MPPAFNRSKIRKHLENFDLRTLFIQELGWDHRGGGMEAAVAERTFALKALAHKRGMIAYQYAAGSSEAFPDHPTRRKIEKAVAKTVHEHIIVYVTHDGSFQYWQWVKREPGRPDRPRLHIYHRGQGGEALAQKLERLAFTLDEEADLSIVDVSGRARAAFDVEKVTRRFYDRFRKEHGAFLDFIDGVKARADREWYASLMLNRMMFIYFIQKRGFLDGDFDYLRNRLERMQREHGKDRFQTFYRLFLLRLFHEGLSRPAADRAPDLARLLGKVPYLNGGLFEIHDLERGNQDIHIPDEAFRGIFQFFDAYQWHLDDRPLHDDKEINPDVLGYIFEKYINQKQMGAYYTKEDITGYIGRSALIPFLFDQAKKECPIAFRPGGGVWRLLQDDPDRYFHESVRHGLTHDIHGKQDLAQKRELPPDIAAGLNDVSQRGGWNKAAPADYALPTETWREHVSRRQRYEEVRARLAAGEIASINDLITYNLDIEKFAQDVIADREGPELVRAFWKALNKVSILDPACGSGAFLFAVLNILEPIYTACLEAMRGFLDDLERSKRKHRPEKLSDFRAALDRVDEHADERYFILKSIIVGNLYGVDIMEEAAEICKLRLFLKLAAQLESYDQIEPLPDIDFNIRAGNTLVGFTSREEVKRALSADMFKREALSDIEERAEIADRAFRIFREMQTKHGMDAGDFANAKLDLRKRLNELRKELDRCLADEYGVKSNDEEAYNQWRESHLPFHWFVEFYGIMRKGGFDVIIGNPPYVEYNKVRKQYLVRNFRTERCGNLYAFCTERSLLISQHGGYFCFIVQSPIVSTSRMKDVRTEISQNSNFILYSTYDDRPSKLFDGMNHCRVAIILSRTIKQAMKPPRLETTKYNKWYKLERDHLFERIQYVGISNKPINDIIPKIHTKLEREILEKVLGMPHSLGELMSASFAKFKIYYKITGVGHWFTFTVDPPKFWRDGVESSSSRESSVSFQNEEIRDTVYCCLNSTLHYWLYQVRTNCRDFNPSDIKFMPIPTSLFEGIPEFQRLRVEIISNLEKNSEVGTGNYSVGGAVSYQKFKPKLAKHFFDQVDKILAGHYGLTDEELDFIINYDIKYRVGLGETEPENDG